MSSFKEAAMSFAVKKAVKYARKDFDKNAPKILSLLEAADVKKVNRTTYAGLHKVLDDPKYFYSPRKTTFAYPFIQFFLGQCLRGGEMFLIFLPIFFILSPNEFQEVINS